MPEPTDRSDAMERDSIENVWRGRLVTACVIILILLIGATVLSLLFNWPDQFDDPGPDRATEEFLWTGTALSPPLGGLALFGCLVLAIHRRRAWQDHAVLGLLLISGLLMLGSLAQLLRPAVPEVPEAVQVTGGLFNVAAFSLVLLLCLLTLRGASHEESAGKAASPHESTGQT